jgi:hypothetical protein
VIFYFIGLSPSACQTLIIPPMISPLGVKRFGDDIRINDENAIPERKLFGKKFHQKLSFHKFR